MVCHLKLDGTDGILVADSNPFYLIPENLEC